MIYLLLRAIAVVLALVISVLYWEFGTAFDLVLGPRTRAARGSSAVVSAVVVAAAVALVVVLGVAAGNHDARFPAGSLAVVTAETNSGQVVSGNAVPVLGSSDVFVLTVHPGQRGPTITRLPAASLKSSTTTWH